MALNGKTRKTQNREMMKCTCTVEDITLRMTRDAKDFIQKTVYNNEIICARQGLLKAIVENLGSLQVPTDPNKYKQFITRVKMVENTLMKDFARFKIILEPFQYFFPEIAQSKEELSPAMSIMFQAVAVHHLPLVLKWLLTEEYFELILPTMCSWLTKWTFAKYLAPLVLGGMKTLEKRQICLEVLNELTVGFIAKFFRLLILPEHRKRVGPILLHMLSLTSSLNNPEAFHQIFPHIPKVLAFLEKENSESSITYLQDIVYISVALIEEFSFLKPSDLYVGAREMLQPYLEKSLRL